MDDVITYMGYEWINVEGGELTIGINEEGISEFVEVAKIDLPSIDDVVLPDEVCGEIDTDQGPMNLYCPIEGTVVEINEAVSENPDLIMEDPLGDGWLFKVEVANHEQIDELIQASTNDED